MCLQVACRAEQCTRDWLRRLKVVEAGDATHASCTPPA
jgi:hypothetical protein